MNGEELKARTKTFAHRCVKCAAASLIQEAQELTSIFAASRRTAERKQRK